VVIALHLYIKIWVGMGHLSLVEPTQVPNVLPLLAFKYKVPTHLILKEFGGGKHRPDGWRPRTFNESASHPHRPFLSCK